MKRYFDLIAAGRKTAEFMQPTTQLTNPGELIGPGCGEQVRCTSRVLAGGRPAPSVPQFCHHDANALCRRADGTVADPIEADPASGDPGGVVSVPSRRPGPRRAECRSPGGWWWRRPGRGG